MYLVSNAVCKCSMTTFRYMYSDILVLGMNMDNRLSSGCGSVGRAVASDSRGPRFESSHGQKFKLKRLLSIVLKRRK